MEEKDLKSRGTNLTEVTSADPPDEDSPGPSKRRCYNTRARKMALTEPLAAPKLSRKRTLPNQEEPTTETESQEQDNPVQQSSGTPPQSSTSEDDPVLSSNAEASLQSAESQSSLLLQDAVDESPTIPGPPVAGPRQCPPPTQTGSRRRW